MGCPKTQKRSCVELWWPSRLSALTEFKFQWHFDLEIRNKTSDRVRVRRIRWVLTKTLLYFLTQGKIKWILCDGAPDPQILKYFYCHVSNIQK